MKAAKSSGMNIARVEVDPQTGKTTFFMKTGTGEETEVNPFHNAPAKLPSRKSKATCERK
jgi:hypothetical protein